MGDVIYGHLLYIVDHVLLLLNKKNSVEQLSKGQNW